MVNFTPLPCFTPLNHCFSTIIEDDLLVEKAVLGQAERLGIQAQWQLRRLGSEEVLAPEEPPQTWGKRGDNG